MFAVIANGIQTICKTQRKLDMILAVYPYPKFCKCATEEEGRAWLRQHSRGNFSSNVTKYGTTSQTGYAQVEYFIWNDTAYYNIDTSRIGYLRVVTGNDMSVDARANLIKVCIKNIHLNDMSIMSHCIAIRRILKVIGSFVDVDIIVPDMSIYLAATKYTGKNYMIKGLQRDIDSRLGGVSFTVREK